MIEEWLKRRGYKHLDAPIGKGFALNTYDSKFVSNHSWSPLLRYEKKSKRYKPKTHKTEVKERPIMYASHRDACILSKYAFTLNGLLEAYYESSGLSKHVIAYRRLGRSNYDFSAAARKFAIATSPCVVLCFDISGFFGHLDHKLLKSRLKRILSTRELSDDWYAVFKTVTQHRWLLRDDLKKHPVFGVRLKDRSRTPVATIAEVMSSTIQINKNEEIFGIPQGTPISSVFANLYLIDFDHSVSDACAPSGALYQRYSDDILIVCSAEAVSAIVSAIELSLAKHKLELSVDKTERVMFGKGNNELFQYLGFYMSHDSAFIRSSSLARQWRKLKRSIARTRSIGEAAVFRGDANKVFTKKLRRRFSPIGAKNFSSYARRAADALESKKIRQQVRRLERAADSSIRDLNK